MEARPNLQPRFTGSCTAHGRAKAVKVGKGVRNEGLSFGALPSHKLLWIWIPRHIAHLCSTDCCGNLCQVDRARPENQWLPFGNAGLGAPAPPSAAERFSKVAAAQPRQQVDVLGVRWKRLGV